MRWMLLLAAAPLLAQQYTPPSSGGGPCTLTGTQTSGYVLTATDGSKGCQWQTVGGASVDANTLKNAWHISDGGTANHITGTTTTTFPGAYATGQAVIVKVANNNTGATDININSLGTKAVTKAGSTALASGNLVSGQEYLLIYDGTQFQAVTYTPIAADFPTLNQNTSGTAANVSGTPALPNGTTATTQSQADNSTKLATTAYVDTGLGGKAASNATTTVNGSICALGGSCTPNAPNLSGTPALPNGTTATTQTAGDSTTKLATDAFVQAAAAPGYTTVSFSATPTFTCGTGPVSSFVITLTANVTSSTLSSCAGGEIINFRICQDATGSRTFVGPTNVSNMGTIDSTASGCSNQGFVFDGTNAQALGAMFVTGVSGGAITLNGSTSGSNKIQPAATAGTGSTTTLPSGNSVTVIGDTGAANNFLTAIDPSTGVISKARPSAANLSDGTTGSSGAVVLAGSPTITTPTIASFTNATHNHTNAAGGGTLGETALSLADNTTNNVSTSNHGFTPKLDNVVTHFLNGQGGWTTPAGGGSGCTTSGTSGQVLEDNGSGGCNSVSLNAVNGQTATYQVLAADFTSYKTITVASGTFTITLVASGSQPPNGQGIRVINYGSGVVTIARSGQNINGGTSSLSLPAGSATQPSWAIIASDGTNYFGAVNIPTPTQIGLGSVTNDAQTKAAIMPNTAPSAGQIPAGNAGGTAYAPVSMSGDCTLASTGAITCTSTNGVTLGVFATATAVSNPQTATYQVLASDFDNRKTITVASGTFTITLVASGSQPATGKSIKVWNYGSGVVTIARSGQNINGGVTSLTLNAGTATAPSSAEILSNGTDYLANVSNPGSGSVPSGSAGQILGYPGGTATAVFPFSPTGVYLPNATNIRAYSGNVATGDHDIYTCSSNKRCLVEMMSVYNSSGGNITYYPELKSGGTYYRLANGQTPATSTSSFAVVGFVLEAAESISVNTTTNNGLNVAVEVVEFDNSAPLFTKKLLGLSTGDNTLYTVTSGKSAFNMNQGNGVAAQSPGQVTVVSDGGATRTYKVYDVASGGSTGTTNLTALSTSAASTRTNIACGMSLASQDFVVVNVDTGNSAQIAWITVVEF